MNEQVKRIKNINKSKNPLYTWKTELCSISQISLSLFVFTVDISVDIFALIYLGALSILSASLLIIRLVWRDSFSHFRIIAYCWL